MRTPAPFNALLFSLLIIASCGSQEGARMPLPGKVGASGEVVVVILPRSQPRTPLTTCRTTLAAAGVSQSNSSS